MGDELALAGERARRAGRGVARRPSSATPARADVETRAPGRWCDDGPARRAGRARGRAGCARARPPRSRCDASGARGIVELTPGDSHALPRPVPPPAATPGRARRRTRRPGATSICAHAVGVLHAVCATSSATLRSTSCPMPVNTGTPIAAIARATSSVSNGARSARDPPPRASTTTSTSSCASCPSAHLIRCGAPRSAPRRRPRRPATRRASAAARRRSRGRRRCPSLVIRPTRSGTGGSSSGRWRRASPSAASARSTRSRLAASRPTVNTGSMPVITSWY